MFEKKYPECNKIAALQTELKTLRNFLMWLNEEHKCEILHFEEHTLPGQSNEDFFADFLGIDNKKVEAERRQMIQEMNNLNKG